jgi:arabinogalactan oligomer/maltooligosaccharide transport system substrate-binding protein
VNLANNPNFINDADGVGISGLRDGSVGAIFSGTWDAKSVQEALTDSEGVCHMGVTQLPTFNLNGEALTMKSFAGSKAIGVNRQSKNMGAALKLAAFLSTEEAQLLHYQLREIPPAVSALTSNEEIAKNLVVVGQALTMSNSSVGQPTIPEMNNYWAPAGNLGTAIYNKEVTLDNAAEQTELFQDALNGTGL